MANPKLDALRQNLGKNRATPMTQETDIPMNREIHEPRNQETHIPKTKKPAGKIQIGFYADPVVRSNLLMLQARGVGKDKTDLILSALNDLFRQYGLPVVE